jgi:hypothetical protein
MNHQNARPSRAFSFSRSSREIPRKNSRTGWTPRPATSAFFAFAWKAGGYRGFRVTMSSANGQPAAVI